MSMHTPRQRGIQRPSMGVAGKTSSPNLLQSASTSVHRKASYNALMGKPPQTPSGRTDDGELSIGDAVNVPGDMYGTVRFVGSVKGKAGTFVGVELGREFAARGKNDGDVDGIQYFTTSIPGSGIFLPVHRAERRDSPAASVDSFPETPTTPSYGTYRGPRAQGRTPPTPALPKFSQSMGPGARPSSPQFKPKSRPSLPRPESPLRKQPTLQPTPARPFSASQRAGSARAPASPAPGRTGTPKLTASTRTPAPPRPYSRTGSRLGQRHESISESNDSVGAQQARNGMSSFSRPMRSPSRLGGSTDDGENQRLREQLQEKDHQLSDQANLLVEMEASLAEIQSLMPPDRQSGDEANGDIRQLRRTVQEKNDKIQSLVAEFDAHRADFRSTIDTLELASSETERVYEAKVADLMAEMEELRELSHSHEDVESVAEQLKALEELVAELEEGLEDARRGEAEARGEVEFLRGEVERSRSELRREREKATEAQNGNGHRGSPGAHSRELEMKDDEIRALKAILHSMGSGGEGGHQEDKSVYSSDAESRQAPVKPPQKTKRHLGRTNPNGKTMNGPSLWCEACETEGHDILTCSNFATSKSHAAQRMDKVRDMEEDELADGMREMKVAERAEEPPTWARPNGRQTSPEVSKENSGRAKAVESDADKWCALCEKDGHLAFDCPEEQY